MQPVLMINKPVEVAKRRLSQRLPMAQPRAIRMKVPLQGHCTHSQPHTLCCRVAVAARVQQSIHSIQQPVYCIRCASSTRAIISGREVLTSLTQLQDHLRDCSAQLRNRPLLQPTQALRKTSPGLGPVSVPNPGQHLLAQLPSTSLSDLERRMQVAQDKRDAREQQLPSLARGFPSVRAYRTRLVTSKDCARLTGKLAVACKQAFGIVFLNDRHAQETAAASRRSQRNFSAFDPGDLLISDQILRHHFSRFYGRTDHIRAPQREPSAIPEHSISPEYIGQSLKGYAPLTEVNSFLNVISAGDHIRHDKRRTESEDLPTLLELDAAQQQFELARVVAVVEGVTFAERLWEQFRVGEELLRQVVAIDSEVLQTRAIVLFTVEWQAYMLMAHGWSSSSPSVFVCATNSMGQLPLAILLFMEIQRATTNSVSIRKSERLGSDEEIRIRRHHTGGAHRRGEQRHTALRRRGRV